MFHCQNTNFIKNHYICEYIRKIFFLLFAVQNISLAILYEEISEFSCDITVAVLRKQIVYIMQISQLSRKPFVMLRLHYVPGSHGGPVYQKI